MFRFSSKHQMWACMIVLPLLLTGCGGKAPKPCKDASKEMMGNDMSDARRKAERFIRNETRQLTKKHGAKITFKPPETKCEEGTPLPPDANTLPPKELKKAKKAAKATCTVKIPYCVKLDPIPGQKPAQKPAQAIPQQEPKKS